MSNPIPDDYDVAADASEYLEERTALHELRRKTDYELETGLTDSGEYEEGEVISHAPVRRPPGLMTIFFVLFVEFMVLVSGAIGVLMLQRMAK